MIPVKFNGKITYIEQGHGQWFDTPTGENRLVNLELFAMKDFPKVYTVSLHQDPHNHQLYYVIFMRIRGIEHKITLKYAKDHPLHEMDVTINYPILDNSRMPHHWYGDKKPCYVEYWNSSWTGIKVATQLRRYLEDYYNGTYADRRYTTNSRYDSPYYSEYETKSWWRFW